MNEVGSACLMLAQMKENIIAACAHWCSPSFFKTRQVLLFWLRFPHTAAGDPRMDRTTRSLDSSPDQRRNVGKGLMKMSGKRASKSTMVLWRALSLKELSRRVPKIVYWIMHRARLNRF